MKIAYTIASANYLPFAKSLADSFIKHNPDYQFVIALADTYTGFNAAEFAPHAVLPVLQMNLPDFDEMNNRYNLFELSCALKPFVGAYLLDAYPGCEALFYLDSDIRFFEPLTTAENLLQTHSIVLTPHLCSPLPYSAIAHTELDILRSGAYNAGFFGLNNSEEARNFLHWWQERLRHHSFNDVPNGLFVDQLWLSLVPAYFRGCFLLCDPGYNLAYWNFSERTLLQKEGRYLVNGEHPLVFYHYSGYDIYQPEKVSRYQREAYKLEQVPEYKPLFEEYREAVLANNASGFLSLPVTMGLKPEKPAREKNFFKRKYKKLFKKK